MHFRSSYREPRRADRPRALGHADQPSTTEGLIHAAREERMFSGEDGIDLVGLTREMPRDITISIEVPTAELAKTVNAEARACRALRGAKAIIAAAGIAP